MLIKGADNRSEDSAALKTLLKDPEITPEQKAAIEHELNGFERGAWGDRDAAYFLNFHFSESENHLLLHDLKIVLSDDRIAHIEHLLVTSFQDFFVLESVHWAQLRVDATGACTAGYGAGEAIPSPLEKCQYDAGILARAMQIDPELKVLAPRAEILPRVMVAPRCILDAPAHDEWYVRGDIFHAQRAKESESMHFVKGLLDLPRHVNHKTLLKIGLALQTLHNPNKTDWRKRLGFAPLTKQHLTPDELLASIEGLAEFVPRWGDDWFILRFPAGKPPLQLLKTLRGTGYDAKKENGEWVWSIKAEAVEDDPTSHWIE